MKNAHKDVKVALAMAIAKRKVPDNVIESVTKKLVAKQVSIRGIDICVYGICIDYFFDDSKWWERLPDLIRVEDGRIRDFEIFPWGIPVPDIFHVRVGHEFEELNQFLEAPIRQ